MAIPRISVPLRDGFMPLDVEHFLVLVRCGKANTFVESNSQGAGIMLDLQLRGNNLGKGWNALARPKIMVAIYGRTNIRVGGPSAVGFEIWLMYPG